MANARVVLNREAADQVRLGLADGLFALCEQIVQQARPPDAPPSGRGLVRRGAAAAWVDGKRVAGTGSIGQGRVPSRAVVAAAGFGFPARFQELGTIKQSPRPFFMPAVVSVLPNADKYIRPAMRARLGF
jgi:hypothetical protein